MEWNSGWNFCRQSPLKMEFQLELLRVTFCSLQAFSAVAAACLRGRQHSFVS
jgi:hypothetical protein